MKLSPLTLAELRSKVAELELRAEQQRSYWRGLVPTSPHASAAGRRVIELEARASDYRLLLGMAETHNRQEVTT
jgi:hypothetical protein